MTGRTDYTAVTNGDAYDPAVDMTSIYEHFDPLVGESAANVAALPASGNWNGRTITTEDLHEVWVWKTTWKLVGGVTPYASRSASAAIAFTTSTTIITGWDTAVETDARLAYASNAWTVGSGYGGRYLIQAQLGADSTALAWSLYCYKGGAVLLEGRGFATTGGQAPAVINSVVELAAGDVIDFRRIATGAQAGVIAPNVHRASITFVGPS
jgi:hypothetical protein